MKLESKYLQELRLKLVEAEREHQEKNTQAITFLEQVGDRKHRNYGDYFQLYVVQAEARISLTNYCRLLEEIVRAEQDEVLHLIHEDVLEQLKELEK